MRKMVLLALLIALTLLCVGCESYCRRCEELEAELYAYEEEIRALNQQLEDTEIDMYGAIEELKGYLYGVEENLSGYFFDPDPDTALEIAIEGQEYAKKLLKDL